MIRTALLKLLSSDMQPSIVIFNETFENYVTAMLFVMLYSTPQG